MQIRKCALIEMFSLVLIGMFSPFFHIIGSRIGAFGLFPFLDAVCLFNFGGTHTSVRQNAARTHGPGCADAAGAAGAAGAGGRRRSRSRARGATGHAAVPRGGACSAAGRPAAPSPPLAWSAAAPPPPGSCRALSWLSGAGAVLGLGRGPRNSLCSGPSMRHRPLDAAVHVRARTLVCVPPKLK